MSRIIDTDARDFSLGDEVSFLHDGDRLTGVVVRVYNSRTIYHVVVGGVRYEVESATDEMEYANL